MLLSLLIFFLRLTNGSPAIRAVIEFQLQIDKIKESVKKLPEGIFLKIMDRTAYEMGEMILVEGGSTIEANLAMLAHLEENLSPQLLAGFLAHELDSKNHTPTICSSRHPIMFVPGTDEEVLGWKALVNLVLH